MKKETTKRKTMKKTKKRKIKIVKDESAQKMKARKNIKQIIRPSNGKTKETNNVEQTKRR